MKLLHYILIPLLLSACTSVSPSNDGYLPMPDNVVGYWSPYSAGTVNTGLNIRADGIIEYQIDDENKHISHIMEYMVFHIEENTNQMIIYMIAKERMTEEELERSPNFYAPKGITPEIREGYSEYYYSYNRFTIKQDYLLENYTVLNYSNESCKSLLSKADMNLPAQVHWERLTQSRYCHWNNYTGGLFGGQQSYVRIKEEN